jgi:peptidylamidoglycolate lyase
MKGAVVAGLLLLSGVPASAQAPVAEPPGYRVVHGWPNLPEGHVLGPSAGVGVTSRGTALVFHRADRYWSEPLPTDPIAAPTIVEFNLQTGDLVRAFGAGQFAMPHGLTVDGDDNIWVTDVALHQVFKLSPEGDVLMTLGERAVPGADTGHFDRPTDIAVLPGGSFYVADGYRNTRIMHFAADGRFVRQWGQPGKGPGEFDTPHAITVDRAGRVYVADRENDRVQVFDADGRFISEWKGAAIGRPYGLTLVEPGQAAIADGGEQPDAPPNRSGLSLVTRDGAIVQRIGRWGNQDGQFLMAHDVAADSDGNLYVVDIIGQRVQKFAPSR